MSKEDKKKSISKKLSNLAKTHNVPYRSIMMAFYLERLLVRIIANKELKKFCIFKGGYVGLRVYNSKRYTIDLDTLVFKKDFKSTLTKIIQSVETDLHDRIPLCV